MLKGDQYNKRITDQFGNSQVLKGEIIQVCNRFYTVDFGIYRESFDGFVPDELLRNVLRRL